MVKEKRILSYFIGWLLLGFIVCFIGVNEIFALQNNNAIWFYDNSGTSATEISTSYNSTINESYANFTTVANSYGGLVVIQVDKPLIKGHIYTLFINVGAESNGGSTKKSTKNCLGIANSKTGSVNNYLNCSITPEYSQDVGVTTDKGRGLYFTFIANNNGAYLSIPYTTQYTCNSCRQYSYGYNIEDAGNSDNLSEEQVDTIINNQTNEINTSINNMQENISSDIKDSVSNITNSITDSQNSINENIDEMTDSINGTLNDSLNNCRDSYNLLNPAITSTSKNGVTLTYDSNSQTITLNGTCTTDNTTFVFPGSINIPSGKTAYVGINYVSGSSTGYMRLGLFDSDWHTYNQLSVITESGLSGNIKNSYKTTADTSYVNNNIRLNNGSSFNNLKFKVFVSYETSTYEEYNKQVCGSKIDETNDTLKGGFSSIGNWFSELGNKIGNFFDNLLTGILDGLKSLFIPEDGYFELWFNDLKMFFEDKLGFLATPFIIIIDFVNRYLELDSKADIIINIPNISVPNFENHIIISATSLNWSQLLSSKDSLNTLWQLYLSFIDVFLILNFINLCENKYNRIFGGDTTQYEYYTVEDSYNVDVNTGEVKNMRRNERKTTRKKVN